VQTETGGARAPALAAVRAGLLSAVRLPLPPLAPLFPLVPECAAAAHPQMLMAAVPLCDGWWMAVLPLPPLVPAFPAAAHPPPPEAPTIAHRLPQLYPQRSASAREGGACGGGGAESRPVVGGHAG
jgi:hypothetical protein